MPASAESLALAERYRLQTVTLRAAFIAEYIRLWQATIAVGTPGRQWLVLAAALIGRWRPVFAQAATDYYRQAAALDRAEHEAPLRPLVLGALSAVVPITAAQIASSLVQTAFGTFRGARFRGLSVEAASDLAMVTAATDAARLAQDAGREQIRRIVERDQLALGWMRVTDADPCAFCAMLASRGPVYKTRETALFRQDPVRGNIDRYHASCACQAVPVFTRTPLLPETTLRAQRDWETSQRQAREADELRRGTSNDSLNALRRYMNRSVDGV